MYSLEYVGIRPDTWPISEGRIMYLDSQDRGVGIAIPGVVCTHCANQCLGRVGGWFSAVQLRRTGDTNRRLRHDAH